MWVPLVEFVPAGHEQGYYSERRALQSSLGRLQTLPQSGPKSAR